MYELRTEVDIDAPAEVVWDILMDFYAYSSWNPFVRTLEGSPSEGGRLKVTLQQPGSKPMSFEPEVVEVEPEKTFAWLGHMVLPRVFDGEHRFEIAATGEGHVRFVQRERFRGILVPLMRKMLETKTRSGFEAMNEALKKRAEDLVS